MSFNLYFATLVHVFHLPRVRRERPVAKARQRAKSQLYRKLYANATGMQNAGTRANICALAPSLRFRPGGTVRVFRDRGEGVIMEVLVVYLKFGEQVVFHLHASHPALPLQHSGKEPSRLLN